jgi:hypothetical protein
VQVVVLPNLVMQRYLKQVYLSPQQMQQQIRSSIVREAQ